MTIKTEAGKPELTYSKTRGLVALVSGTDHYDWIFLILYNRVRRLRSLLNNFSIFCVAAFMKQRKMGLNDFIQRLATNSYACKQ